MSQTRKVEGGCQCGAVRYTAVIHPDTAHICHCRMCQKAVGNLFAALVGTMKPDLHWTRGEPAAFRSSRNVERGFCAACGTPLFYRSDASDHMSITIGSLDHALDVLPAFQVGTEARADWVTHIGDMTSEGATEDGQPDEAEQIRRTSRQHPDHDTDQWPPAAGTSL